MCIMMPATGNRVGCVRYCLNVGTDDLAAWCAKPGESAGGNPKEKIIGWLLLIKHICVASNYLKMSQAQEQQDTISKEGDAPGPLEHADTAAIRSSGRGM